MVIVANYTFGFSFSYHALHLERERVFGFARRPSDYPPSVDNDSHRLDYVNFSCPQVTIPTIQPNVVENVGMQ
jgi:hypothetical protein